MFQIVNPKPTDTYTFINNERFKWLENLYALRTRVHMHTHKCGQVHNMCTFNEKEACDWFVNASSRWKYIYYLETFSK
jgi:hypothetical protein